jgi:hypothetical protein
MPADSSAEDAVRKTNPICQDTIAARKVGARLRDRTDAHRLPSLSNMKRRCGGVEFIDENGGGPGVRLRKRQQKKG